MKRRIHAFERLRHAPPVALIVVVTMLGAMLPPLPAHADSVGSPLGSAVTDEQLTPPGAVAPPESGGSAWAGALASVEPSTGIAHASYPFELAPARGTPVSLALTYASTNGDGEAGAGWRLDVPSIERRGPSGMLPPTYHDQSGLDDWDSCDRFVYGGQPLVPICFVGTGGACASAPADDPPFPDAMRSGGWWYYRLAVETGPASRFFLSPDKMTWFVQFASGETAEFGQPVGAAYPAGLSRAPRVDLETDPSTLFEDLLPTNLPHVFRWRLAWRYDAERAPTSAGTGTTDGTGDGTTTGSGVSVGKPATNIVVYDYDGLLLTDIFDTPRADGTGGTAAFEHHTHLTYAEVRFPPPSPPTWRATPRQHLVGVDVTSAPSNGVGPRQLVRRYHLVYQDPRQGRAGHSVLTDITPEGRCAAPVMEDASGLLPATSCPRLPTTHLGYSAPLDPQPAIVTPQTSASGVKIPLDIDGDGYPDLMNSELLPFTDVYENLGDSGVFGPLRIQLPAPQPDWLWDRARTASTSTVTSSATDVRTSRRSRSSPSPRRLAARSSRTCTTSTRRGTTSASCSAPPSIRRFRRTSGSRARERTSTATG